MKIGTLTWPVPDETLTVPIVNTSVTTAPAAVSEARTATVSAAATIPIRTPLNSPSFPPGGCLNPTQSQVTLLIEICPWGRPYRRLGPEFFGDDRQQQQGCPLDNALPREDRFPCGSHRPAPGP